MIIKPPGMLLSNKIEKSSFPCVFYMCKREKKVLTILSVCLIHWPRKWSKKIGGQGQYCTQTFLFSTRNYFSCKLQLLSRLSVQFLSICVKSLRHSVTFSNLPHPCLRDGNRTDQRTSNIHLSFHIFPNIINKLISYCSCLCIHYF